MIEVAAMRSMGTVIAINGVKGLVAVRSADHSSHAILEWISGPRAEVGDVVGADFLKPGKQTCVNVTKAAKVNVNVVLIGANENYIHRLIGD
jgi:hypothetical protein